jgi:hypothetical protein
MACININTKEYKALEEKYKDRMVVDALITNYQQASKSDIIPSIFEVEELIKDTKAYYSLEKKTFEKSVFGNLKKKKLVTKFNNEFYVVNTVPGQTKGSIARAKYNLSLTQSYLKHHGFESLLSFSPTKNNKTFKVEFNDTLFNVKDIIAESPYTPVTKSVPQNIENLKEFEGTIIEYVEHIGLKEDSREIGARNVGKGKKIQVVLSAMKEKFKNKTWTNPVNSEPLPENAFKTFEEFMLFMFLHEKAHEYIFRNEGETLSSYETRINNEALRRLRSESNLLPAVSNAETNILQLVDALIEKFPGVNVEVMTANQAEYFLNTLPVEARPAKLDFKKVKSFYFNGKVVLIKGRISKDTAVEEVLHPFIESLYLDNQELFRKLHSEARKSFPELNMQIEETYKKGFSPKIRALELVTQSLVRHFNNEYENKPGRAWYESIIEFLQWFKDVVKEYYRNAVGQGLPIKTEYISSSATLTDIARLLNTDKLKFDLVKSVSSTAMFALTPQTEFLLDSVKKGANEIQSDIIDNLFNRLESSNIEYDVLGLNRITLTENQYIDVDDTSIDFRSSEELILGYPVAGSISDLNIDLHNILGALITQTKLEDINLSFLNEAAAEKIMNQLNGYMYGFGLHEDRSVFIPAVVVGNSENGIADTIDVIKINPEGVITPISLSFDEASRNSTAYSNDVMSNESKLFPNGVTKSIFSDTRSALQRRLLENLGYRLTEDSLVINILSQNKQYNVEGISRVSSTKNQSVISETIPLDIDPIEKDIIDQLFDLNAAPQSKEDFLTVEEALPENNQDVRFDAYESLFNNLTKFDKGLMTREESISSLMNYISMDKGRQEIMDEIAITRSLIAEVHDDGSRIRKIYSQVVERANKEIREFKTYATDPSNFDKKEYIGKILAWQKFVENFRGLTNFTEKDSGLNKNELLLVSTLTNLLNDLVGTRSNGEIQERGVFDVAIRDYVRNLIKTKSNRDFTETQLNEIMTTAEDIGAVEFGTGTMATSKDTILAIMDKIFKRDRQIVLDKIAERAPRIKAATLALERLGNPNYDFMLEYVNGEFTGRYVKEIGKQYYDERDVRYKKLQDENGTTLRYRIIEDKNNAKQEDLDFNIKLAEDKKAYNDFMSAERFGANGPVDGEFHKYSKEFKKAREKHEVWFQQGEYGYWVQRQSVSAAKWSSYRAKYYNSFTYDKAVRDDNGVPTGETVLTAMKAPTKRYREIRKETSQGVDQRNAKWTKLHNPQTELEIAQLNFYEMFTDVYENELLGKIPENINMIGSVPVIEGAPQKSLKDKTTIVGRLWANTKRWGTNLVHPSTSIKKVFTDEYGNIITDSLPLMYVGSVRTDKALTDIQNEIDSKNVEYQKANLASDKKVIWKELAALRGKQRSIENKPTVTSLSLDMSASLLQFSAMAENYEVMSQSEDTYIAMLSVLKDRKTTNTSGDVMVDKALNVVGVNSGADSKLYQRAKKWMKMTYYNNDGDSAGFFEKVTKGIINQTSLAYVGFNVFANVNNYLFGRLSNTLESIGSRYWDGSQMINSVAEFSGRAMQDSFARLAEMADSESNWKPANYNSKYIASVEFFRMMDNKADMREQTRNGEGGESLWRKFTNWGFFLQDQGEFNVQSKVGNAILRSSTATNTATGETEGLYDALVFDSKTGELTMKEGFDQVQIYNRDKPMVWNSDAIKEIRNYIREVNIQIHGNYAYEDRMVIQSHALGQLAAQFHKWVAPSIKARFRPEYFDENLGWTEGRYLTFWNYMSFAYKNIGDISKLHTNYKEHHGVEGKRKLQNATRTMGEIGLVISTLIMRNILIGLFEDDDDDSDTRKRLENAMIFQADRLRKELTVFNPIPGMGGLQQMHQLFKSPVAAARTMGELGQALEMTVGTGLSWAFMDDKSFRDSKYIYKRGDRKGQIKLGKEWGDAMPILYMINRWKSYLNVTDFYIK